MKKLSTLFVCLSLFVAVNAQNERAIRGNGDVVTQKRQTVDYDKISLSGDFDLELVAGKEGEISVEAESNIMDWIIIESNENELKIHLKNGKHLKHDKQIRVTVPVEQISAVSSAGSGDINSKITLKATTFKVSLAGSGDVNLTVEANEVKASLAGSGNLKLNGSATDFDASIAGSGDIDAEALKAKNVKASIAGSGDIKVYSSESIKGSISGSGDIKYKGEATKINKSISGSGSVSKL